MFDVDLHEMVMIVLVIGWMQHRVYHSLDVQSKKHPKHEK